MGLAMERPYKRQRLSDPPEIELHHRREQNDLRLKSTFESIFEKYGKDFGGIGDEIDLETGEIIVNNGHILGMANERDAGDLDSDSEEEESDDWSDDEGVLASSLLLETRRRIGAIGSGSMYERRDYIDEELQSEDEADSLMGDNDSLMGDPEPEPILPAMRTNYKAPDSLYDDEEEDDELARRDSVWTTPRKAWSTPTKATPLGHTPWHSSPLKPIYKHDTPVDPAWRAPPLPTDRGLWKHDRSLGLIKKHETKDLRPVQPMQGPLRSSETRTPRQRRASIINLPGQLRSLDHRRQSDTIEDTAQSRSVKSLKAPRWTKAEENLLWRLRTTTRLMYSEIKAYFPRRKTKAIMIHWSAMTKKDGNRRPYDHSPKSGGAVQSSSRRSSTKYEGDVSPVNAGRGNSTSNAAASEARTARNGGIDPQASAFPHFAQRRAISFQDIKRETTPPRLSLEIPNSSDPTEESHRIRSSSLTPFASQRASPAQAVCHISPIDDVQEEVHAEPSILTTVSVPDIEAAVSEPLRNVAMGPQPSPQFALNELQAESTRSTSSRLCRTSRSISSTSLSSGRASESQSERSLSSKRAVFVSSYQSDDSDDELSAPIKTVGSHRSRKRRVSTPMLSNIFLNRSTSSASRRS